MSNQMSTTQNKKEKGNQMSPKTGARGIRDRNEKRDKIVRITSRIYDEMMKTGNRRAAERGEYNIDFHDVLSEVWEFFKKEHKGK